LRICSDTAPSMQISSSQGPDTITPPGTVFFADLSGSPAPRKASGDWRRAVLLGPLLARFGGDASGPPSNWACEFEDPGELGYCILGPIAFAFMTWLSRRACEHNIGRFYFLARGGYFLHELYVKLRALDHSLPEARYLIVSRRATLPAAFAVSGNEASILAGAGGFHGTFGAFLNARLGLSPDMAGDSAGISIDLPSRAGDALELISRHAERIKEACSDSLHLLRRYLEQEKLTEAVRPALVDLGYSATIQKALQTVLGRPLIGCYFGATLKAREAEAAGGIVGACFGEELPSEPLPEILGNAILLEAFFAGPTGQADGYREDMGRIIPVHCPEPESGQAFARLREVAAGMEAYCLDLVSAYGPAILCAEFGSQLAMEPLLQLLSGSGRIPESLRPALKVDDTFCGNDTWDVPAVYEAAFGIKL
jgi:hypothetical protein